MSDLTVLCVTANRPYAQPFLDAMCGIAGALDATFVEYDGSKASCLEEVLDDAVAVCPDGYILRLDDDERMTREMEMWLYAREYRDADHWAFCRMNLYASEEAYIVDPPLWPDLQTRLSVKAKSGGRRRIHEGSPFGTGRVAPEAVAIEHHKFLVRSEQERRDLLNWYEQLQPGAGHHYVPFSLPEALPAIHLQTRAMVAA